MKRYLALIISIVSSLGFMISCGDDDNNSDSDKKGPIVVGGGSGGGSAYQGEVNKYLGTYLSECIGVDTQNKISAVIQLKIAQDKLSNLTAVYVYDGDTPTCEDANMLWAEEEIDELMVTGVYRGGNTIKTTFKSYFVIPMNQGIVDEYNQEMNYGKTDWILGEPKDVTQEEKQHMLDENKSFISSDCVKKVDDKLYVTEYDPELGDNNPDPEENADLVFTLVQ